eukprot:CAMPEP_0117685584 /NCGR_PEP_ID=MMETSP0804-20121206/21860_1 /TAXON_ID=1074897 /ORGANISM="Tetraselmis astigmatica, Strain CCMP880" /LENGTH=55 /DNA_ID=CAMNT_0005496951 /DNA_START=99 /DNA_END=266 /DNA_ORIENTATION=-
MEPQGFKLGAVLLQDVLDEALMVGNLSVDDSPFVILALHCFTPVSDDGFKEDIAV